jgi:hypothetical protein
LHNGAAVPSSLLVTGKTSTTVPDVYEFGSLKVTSANTRTIDTQTLSAISIR